MPDDAYQQALRSLGAQTPSPEPSPTPATTPSSAPIMAGGDAYQRAVRALPSATPIPPGNPYAQPFGGHIVHPFHGYDVDIEIAAHQHNVSPMLLQQVLYQESGLGEAANYNPATGHDRDGNPGVGLGQLDPSSGASRAVLERAATDPMFAINYAAGMLHNELQNSGGNVREALSQYNHGPGYAAQVLGRNLDPVAWAQHTEHVIAHAVRAPQPHTPQGQPPTPGGTGLLDWVSSVASNVVLWERNEAREQSRGVAQAQELYRQHPAPENPMDATRMPGITLANTQSNAPASVTSAVQRSAEGGLHNVATAAELPMELLNASARDENAIAQAGGPDPITQMLDPSAAPQWMASHPQQARQFSEGSAARGIWNTLRSPNMSIPQKLDNLAAIYGTNSALDPAVSTASGNQMAEVNYWASQPNLTTRLRLAHPTTPQGVVYQYMLAGRSDLANFKLHGPGGVAFAGVETFGLELFNPSYWGVPELRAGAGAAARGLAEGAASVLERDAAASAAEADVRSFGKPQSSPRVPPTNGEVVAQRLLNETSSSGSPLGFQFARSERVNPLPAAVRRPPRAAVLMAQGFRGMLKTLGPAYENLAENGIIVGNRFHNMGRVYGGYGEYVHNSMIADHAAHAPYYGNLIMSPQFAGGLPLDAQWNLPRFTEMQTGNIGSNITHLDENGRPSGAGMPPEFFAHYGDLNTIQRGTNFSNLINDMTLQANEWLPVTRNYFHQMDPVYSVDPQTGAQSVVNYVNTYWPRRTTWEYQHKISGQGNSVGGSAGLGLRTRRQGTLAQAQQSTPILDEAGRPILDRLTGKPLVDRGLTLSAQWNPVGDLARKLIANSHYITMVKHIHFGRSVQSLTGADAATLDIHYAWPGDQRLSQHFIENWGGRRISLGVPVDFGTGAEGYAKMQGYLRAAPAGGARVRAAAVGGDETQSARAIELASTRDFAKQHPNHAVNAGEVLRTPDIPGLAVERHYLAAVADANPVLRYRLGSDDRVVSVSHAVRDQVQGFESLRDHTDRFDYSDLTGKELADVHFSGLDEEGVYSDGLRWLDTMNSATRMMKLLNPIYHPLFNTYPAMLNVLLEHAGQNPVKIINYAGQISRALGIAEIHGGRTLLQGARDLINATGRAHLPNVPQVPFDIPDAWIRRAQEYHAISHGFGLGMPADQYVRMMSLPWSDLPWSTRISRTLVHGQQWNQKVVFDIQEARLVATAHHVLVDLEGLSPEIAARRINKAINDYANLTHVEQSPAMRRVYWFYNFMRMQTRRGASLMLNAPQIPSAYNRAIASINAVQGNPNATEQQVTMGGNAKTGFNMMSASSAGYRYPEEVMNILLGSTDDRVKAMLKMGTTNLTPLFWTAWHGLAMQGVDALRGTGHTPNPADVTSPLTDRQAPANQQWRQAAQMLLSPTTPMGPFPSTYTMGKAQSQQWGIGQDLRADLAHAQSARATGRRMPVEVQRQAAALIEKLENGTASAQDILQAKMLSHTWNVLFQSRPSKGFSSGGFRF